MSLESREKTTYRDRNRENIELYSITAPTMAVSIALVLFAAFQFIEAGTDITEGESVGA